MKNLNDVLKHSGVMGMKWGVHRDRSRPGGADGKFSESEKLAKSTFGKKWNSLKRERQWHSVLKQVENLSNSEISLVTKRLGLENNLKRLTRSKVATKKDKEDYLRRSHMDDQELSRKIARLSLKDGLHKAVHEASKQQREFGKKVVNIGGSLGARYVLNKGSLELNDIVGAFKDPKGSAATAKGDVQKELAKRGKEILNKARARA